MSRLWLVVLVVCSVQSFAANLAAPVLASPLNQAPAVALPVGLSWSTVTGASAGYRILIATTASALPTDPSTTACSCVVNATSSVTSYSASALQAGITYYWEVHGRGTTEFATWSAISSFTTQPAPTFSVSVDPGAQIVARGQTATYTVTVQSQNAFNSPVALTAQNLPGNQALPGTGFSSQTVTPAANGSVKSTLTIATNNLTPTGVFSILVTGTGGGFTHAVYFAITINQIVTQLPPPTFVPSSQTFSSPQFVGIIDPSATSIYYTTDLTPPTTSSTLFSSPILVSSSETIRAIAVGPGYVQSLAGSATYTLQTASWSKLANPAPGSPGVMTQLTDGTIMIQQGGSQNWMRLTPDARGSYINGDWTKNPISPMSILRQYFASEVLPSGKVWVLGGEYSGPALIPNHTSTGEIFDPIANSWSPVAPYPPQNCGASSLSEGSLVQASSIITQIPTTAGLQPGFSVTGLGIPSNTLVKSVDSSSQIHISTSATVTLGASLTFGGSFTGNTTAGSSIITGIPTTAGLQAGWIVSGTGILQDTSITSVDSLNQIHIIPAAAATQINSAVSFEVVFQLPGCFGDAPSILLPSGKILAGNISNNSTHTYDVATNSWTLTAQKVYNDRSDEEGWVMLGDGTVLTYDIFQSVGANKGFAERYNPTTNSWSSISPSDGTANGFLPVLSSAAVGFELGPILRLQDGRVFVIGANGHTALYTPSTNTWAAGPDILGTLNGHSVIFGADDAPAAELPNGHVIFTADAGPQGFTSSANIAISSPIVTGIVSTAILQVGWGVTGPGIPPGTSIKSIDSTSQIHISNNATATISGAILSLGGTFSFPTQLFDFDPAAGTIAPASPAMPNNNLNFIPSFVTRMLVLPTGQLLVSDGSLQLWVYTPAGSVNPAMQPLITNILYEGSTLFKLFGIQLNGQSAGSSYGDDVESDDNYPIIRMVDQSGNVFYAKTTNWNTIGVGGTALQAVDFTLNQAQPPGNYSAIVSGAGISSLPFAITITSAERF